jgi:hypothetical protein
VEEPVTVIAPVAPKAENRISQNSHPVARADRSPAGPGKGWTTTKVVPAPKPPPPYAFKPLPRPGAKLTAEPAAPPAKPARMGWTTRLNPFRPPEPVVPPAEEQTQFSLDAVKVVHNDLSDAEVEVVPVKAHAEVPQVPVLPPARQAWEYLGEKILKPS